MSRGSAASSGLIEPVPSVPLGNPDPALLHGSRGLVEVIPRVVMTFQALNHFPSSEVVANPLASVGTNIRIAWNMAPVC